jgi:hypothetical protein
MTTLSLSDPFHPFRISLQLSSFNFQFSGFPLLLIPPALATRHPLLVTRHSLLTTLAFRIPSIPNPPRLRVFA